jgi:O-antigen ligase
VTSVPVVQAPAVARPVSQGQQVQPQRASRHAGRPNVVKAVMVGAIWAMPLLVPAGPGNTAPADVFLAAAIVVSAIWLARRRHAMRFPYMFPIGLSVLAGALASTVAYVGGDSSAGSGVVTLVQDGFLLAWGIAIANIGRDPALLRSMTRAWAASATCWALLMIIGVVGHVSLLSGETARTGARAAFTLGDPNLAANYFICSLLVLRAMQYPGRRVLRWACCVLIVTAVVLTGSNGGALVLVVSTVAGAIFGIARRHGAARAIIAVSALVLAAAVIAPQVHVTSIVQKAQSSSTLLQDSIGRQAESSGSRSTILAETMQLYLTSDTPLGIGAGGTKEAFQSHMYAYVKMAHDDYTASIVERGVLGGFALLCLLVIVAARCRRIAARPLRPDYAALFPRPELLAAAVIGMFVSATLYQVLHFRHLWALLGVVAAVDIWGRKGSNRDHPAADVPPSLSARSGLAPEREQNGSAGIR